MNQKESSEFTSQEAFNLILLLRSKHERGDISYEILVEKIDEVQPYLERFTDLDLIPDLVSQYNSGAISEEDLIIQLGMIAILINPRVLPGVPISVSNAISTYGLDASMRVKEMDIMSLAKMLISVTDEDQAQQAMKKEKESSRVHENANLVLEDVARNNPAKEYVSRFNIEIPFPEEQNVPQVKVDPVVETKHVSIEANFTCTSCQEYFFIQEIAENYILCPKCNRELIALVLCPHCNKMMGLTQVEFNQFYGKMIDCIYCQNKFYY